MDIQSTIFRLICYVQQLRLIHGGRWGARGREVLGWQSHSMTHHRVIFCCSQIYYNGGCYFRVSINGKIAVPAAADSRTLRNKRGTETDYYVAKFYALYSVFLMHNHYHCGPLSPGLWHAYLWRRIPNQHTILKNIFLILCADRGCLWSELYVIRDETHLRCERARASQKEFAFIMYETKLNIFFFWIVILFVKMQFKWIPSRDLWVLSKCLITEPKDSRRSIFQRNFAYCLFSALGNDERGGSISRYKKTRDLQTGT